MNERLDMQDLFHGGLKGLCIYGTAVAFDGWKYQTKDVIKKQLQPVVDDETQQPIIDDTGQPIQEYQPMQIKETIYDDPDVEFIDLGLFFVDPAAVDIDPARYCGHVSHMTKTELQNKEEIGLFKLDWKKIPKDSKGNKARDYRMSSVGLPTFDDQISEDADEALYEVLHYWEDDKYVAIINRAFVACDTPNPYWHKKKPYDKAVYTMVPGEFYGMGIPEMVEDLQDELNAERNQRIDFRSMCLRRMFKVRKGSQVDKNQLKWRQNGIILVDDIDNDVKEMNVQDIPASSFSQENIIKQDMQDTTGAHDVVMGTADSKETATSTMTKDNNASMRFKLTISNIEKRLMVNIARKMVQNNQQFIDTERVLRVTGDNGDQWVTIAPEEIQGEFDYVCMGSSVEPLANKEAFKQRMTEMYQIASQDPIYQQFPAKRMALLKKVFESFDIKDVEAVLPTEEEMQQQADQQALMQQQQDQQNMELEMAKLAGKGQGGLNTSAQVEQGLGGGAY